jgi:transcriptional regulator with XRE-family HTH domain
MASAKEGLRSIGELIRARRAASNLTQAQLGKRAGIVGKYVSEIERGTRDVPYSTLHAIVDGLDLHLDVRFGTVAESRGAKPPPPLPRAIEQLARTIAELPAEPRATVLAAVRMMLRLVKR